MIQKAAKGDTSAAKFIWEINGETPAPEEAVSAALHTLSDAVLFRLAGMKLEEMLFGE